MENTNTDATKKEYTILYPDVYDELQDCGGKMTYEQAVEKAKATSKNTGYVYLYADEDLDKPDGVAEVYKHGKFAGKESLAA